MDISQRKKSTKVFGVNLLMLFLMSELTTCDRTQHKVRQQLPITDNKRTSSSKPVNENVEEVMNNLAKFLKMENRTLVVQQTNNTVKSSEDLSNFDHTRDASLLLPVNISDIKLSAENKTHESSMEHKNYLETEQNLPKQNCRNFGLLARNRTENEVSNFCYSPTDSLTCYQDPIFCDVYHMSGKRELEWPVYGEYSYLPHKHWVRILQHGGVVFLYHPCANQSSVAKLRSLAETCMRRFVLTPYQKLTYEKPLAMVSWGCYLLMRDVNLTHGKEWIKSHAFKAPASHVHKNGQFEKRLVKASNVITDIRDTYLCPDDEEKAAFSTAPPPEPKPGPTASKHAVEDLLRKRLAKVKHIKKTHREKNITQISVNTRKAFSAFSSLVFLCVLLALLLLYTKLWRPSAQGRYQRVYESEAGPPHDTWNDQFSLLKSSQNFMKSFKRNNKERKLDSMSSVKLLAPISEEDDEFENIY